MPTHPHPATLLAERAAQRSPSDLGRVVAEVAAEVWGAAGAMVLLTTYEETELVAFDAHRDVTPIDDGPAGRCFTLGRPESEDGTTWVPLTYRSDRFGVLSVSSATAPPTDDLVAYADAVALQLAADRGTSDVVEIVRRTREMQVGAELVTSLAPPLTYTDHQVSLAAVMEPTYESGGDGLDYSIDDDVLRATILDATGHDFASSQISATAVAAYRSARRAGQDLAGAWALMDRFVELAGADLRYATALLIELRLDTGQLSWLSAGHEAPVIVRADGTVETLEGDPNPPLGTGLSGEPTVCEEFLEAGDVLVLYTDGLTEARALDGHMLGLDGFLEALRVELRREGLLAERLRRLRLDILAREDAWLSDDATALVIEWAGPQD